MEGLFSALWRDESGATAIEYGLIAGLMAALLVGALGGLGEKFTNLFTAIANKLDAAASSMGGGG